LIPRRIPLLTAIALLAFASNSLLCRVALGRASIDPAAFTGIRLVSGALVLALISSLNAARRAVGPGDSSGTARRSRSGWRSGFLLFAYAIAFSFAYVPLAAGTGALILFAAVQVTIVAGAIRSGERPHAAEWTGLALALGGLVYLASPGLAAPSPVGCALMAGAGVAWGLYTLRGRASTAPLADTARNFLCAAPMALVMSAAMIRQAHVSVEGAALAVASGALASGLGYVVWYAALRGLTATRAATVQLAVPVIAAIGGVAILSERITLRLIVSAILILGGIGLALLGRTRGKP